MRMVNRALPFVARPVVAFSSGGFYEYARVLLDTVKDSTR